MSNEYGSPKSSSSVSESMSSFSSSSGSSSGGSSSGSEIHSPGDLWLTATWSGLCSDGIYRVLKNSGKFNLPYPFDWSGFMVFIGDGTFEANLQRIGNLFCLGYVWYVDGWNCHGGANFFALPPAGPFVVGPHPADYTSPPDQGSTWKLTCY